jgi:hypothetical protein
MKNSIGSTSLNLPFWDDFFIRTKQSPPPAFLSLYLGSRFPFSVEDLFPLLAARSNTATDGCCARRAGDSI